MRKKGSIYIGTSGWQYKHWKGTFYPADLKQDAHFPYYLKSFNTVEINNSFYHLPESSVFKKWRISTPGDFVYAVKGSRYITHMKKLKDCKDALLLFLKNSSALKEKRGPILFQLPPGWKLNIDRLKEFLQMLPKRQRFTFEFRNTTWYDERVYDLLRRFNCAFCIYELDGHRNPEVVTSDFVYIRLHGPGKKYQGSYTTETLKKWAKKIEVWRKERKDVYVYFDNDQNGYAAFNAEKLIRIIGIN